MNHLHSLGLGFGDHVMDNLPFNEVRWNYWRAVHIHVHYRCIGEKLSQFLDSAQDTQSILPDIVKHSLVCCCGKCWRSIPRSETSRMHGAREYDE
jgi:hypothetical protein